MAIASNPASFERHLAFDGCFNFRDLGGYGTRDGRTVRARRLFRADGPHALTDADARRLGDLGVTTIIDLRMPTEAAERGHYAGHLPHATTYPLSMTDVLPDSDELPSWIDPEFVAVRYREMLDAGHEAVSETLAILTDPDAYPAMIHCSAGKDRTGILSAIVLGVLGVPDETIVEDYALSGAAMHQLVEHFRRTYPDATEHLSRITPALVAADPAAMRGFLDLLAADFGSIDGYVTDLGLATTVPYLRANLLDA
jgi:protein tyrosine/serine phosphatase